MSAILRHRSHWGNTPTHAEMAAFNIGRPLNGTCECHMRSWQNTFCCESFNRFCSALLSFLAPSFCFLTPSFCSYLRFCQCRQCRLGRVFVRSIAIFIGGWAPDPWVLEVMAAFLLVLLHLGAFGFWCNLRNDKLASAPTNAWSVACTRTARTWHLEATQNFPKRVFQAMTVLRRPFTHKVIAHLNQNPGDRCDAGAC